MATLRTPRQQTALVLGAGGFIGQHLVRRLHEEGYWVRGVDRVMPRFSPSDANEFLQGDLRDPRFCAAVVYQDGPARNASRSDAGGRAFDEVYQLAADMGGVGYISTGEHDAEIMLNSSLINVNVLRALTEHGAGRLFFSSSACVYPLHHQRDPAHPHCEESSAYPAAPDTDYGWEKLTGERLCLAAQRNHGMSVCIARFHNVFGPEGTWQGGREKAPAAICRKVAEASDGGVIEIWGDGEQTRSFLFIDECIEGIRRLMRTSATGPVNLGSEEKVTINTLVQMTMTIAGKHLRIRHIDGPQGVRGRTSDNTLLCGITGWKPTMSLSEGVARTYVWILEQLRAGTTPAADAQSVDMRRSLANASAAARSAASNRVTSRSSS